MNIKNQDSDAIRPSAQLLYNLAVAISAFLLNSASVMLIWIEGSEMTTIDNPAPNEPGILTHPLSVSWKLLLGLILLLNPSLLGYLLAKQRYGLALALGFGAVVPLFYLSLIMLGQVA